MAKQPRYDFNKKSGSYTDPGYIMKDGHTMMLEDTVNDIRRLQRLALAAPDMLEALKGALSYCYEHGDTESFVVELIKKAIAKAEVKNG